VDPKRTEKEKLKRSRVWVHPIICDWLFWTTFEDLRREEAKFLIILECK